MVSKFNQREPMYGWALTEEGKPISISEAKRGGIYFCPITKTRMVAKKGPIKQHHFAHLDLVHLTPDNVARAVAGIWIALKLEEYRKKGDPIHVTWKTDDQQESHKLNILKDIAEIVQDTSQDSGVGDVILKNAEGEQKVVILLGLGSDIASREQIHAWVQSGTTVVKLNPVGVRSGQMKLLPLLNESEVVGGWWLLEEEIFPEGMLVKPEAIRDALKKTVVNAPHVFYGELSKVGTLSHIVDLGEHKLWLPPEFWEETIGGSKNHIGHGVDVIIQEWELDAQNKLALFYITANDSCAIAIKRYPANEPVIIRLDTSAFRLGSTSALHLAMQFVGAPYSSPQ